MTSASKFPDISSLNRNLRCVGLVDA